MSEAVQPDRRILEIQSVGIAGGGIFLVLRHVHGIDGRVLRSRMVAAFADPEDAEEWRSTWTEEEMEFEERVETMYLVFEREADRKFPRDPTAMEPTQEWLEAGRAATEEWMEKHGYSDEMKNRLMNADRMERARYYVEWVEVTGPGQVPTRMDVAQVREESGPPSGDVVQH